MRIKEMRQLHAAELDKTLIAKEKELSNLYIKGSDDHKQRTKALSLRRDIARLITLRRERRPVPQ